jgi:phosphatidylglycerol---prolipoprotein diacylglyceryl transferase
MFLYESLSGLVGMLVLVWLARRFATRLRPGDLLLIFFIWYGTVRFGVESLKADNGTFFGVPVAQIIAAITVVGAAVILVARHLRAAQPPNDANDAMTPDVVPFGEPSG